MFTVVVQSVSLFVNILPAVLCDVTVSSMETGPSAELVHAAQFPFATELFPVARVCPIFLQTHLTHVTVSIVVESCFLLFCKMLSSCCKCVSGCANVFYFCSGNMTPALQTYSLLWKKILREDVSVSKLLHVVLRCPLFLFKTLVAHKSDLLQIVVFREK